MHPPDPLAEADLLAGPDQARGTPMEGASVTGIEALSANQIADFGNPLGCRRFCKHLAPSWWPIDIGGKAFGRPGTARRPIAGNESRPARR
jgi:hypothetical protein